MGSTPLATPPGHEALVRTFVQLADTLTEDFDLVDFLATLTERVVELGLASQAGILLVDEADELRFVAASDERTELLELFQVQTREGPCQDCFRSGTPVTVPRLRDEIARWPAFAPRAIEVGFEAVQAVPLRLRGHALGAMNLFHATPDEPGLLDGSVVQGLADVATISVLQQRELHRAHVIAEQLQRALDGRITIEQAKGVVFEQAGVSMDEAFVRIRRYARDHNLRLREVARDLTEGRLDATALVAG